MFGMSFPEIIIIAIIAVLFLGPDKLPGTMVEIARFFKTVKKTVNDAKANFDQEIKIAELKEDAKKYKENISKTTESVRKKLTFEELDELKKGINDVTGGLNKNISDIKSSIDNIKNPQNIIKDAVLDDKKNEEKKEA
ncbi:Sec-independent protein translocase protein TatB [Campylobacter sp. RM16187]|uniref:Sec-independent protein translocase protein TatB n=1 Tax=Campylobacter sp. RM16187 TaxID=1660063 RepID=UPI0021B4EE77|nr:Sec-independent protein translocase protein TatB [Campylobacter sp. RM16187]QKG29036.1 twin arginine translocation system, TatB family protein [Campylobacter sp. RM16187]